LNFIVTATVTLFGIQRIVFKSGILNYHDLSKQNTARRIINFRKYIYIILFFLVLIMIKIGVTGIKGLFVRPSLLSTITITIQLFAIMDPVGALPFYLYFLNKLEGNERNVLWSTVVISMTVLLFFFALVGNEMLKLFGVSIYSFMIGGGVLLMIIAIDTMGEGSRSLTLDPKEAAIVPLASPLLVGPGTAATLIILSNTIPLSELIISLMIIAIFAAVILKYSENILKIIGKNGVTAFSRLFSIIVAGFAAQLLYEGLVGWGIIKLICVFF
jgi:multiple antibiotic resistance protein